jgi:hypothetical protein
MPARKGWSCPRPTGTAASGARPPGPSSVKVGSSRFDIRPFCFLREIRSGEMPLRRMIQRMVGAGKPSGNGAGYVGRMTEFSNRSFGVLASPLNIIIDVLDNVWLKRNVL